MVTSNATKQQTRHDADKMVQVAEAYSYLSDQKEINLDSIPLPLTPPPSKQEQSANILEQTIIKQKRLARFKNTDLRRKILLKRTFDLVCEIMDHENGFDFEDETETINKKQATSSIRTDDEDDDDSSSDSDSDSSDDDDDDDDSSSSSGSSDESDEEEEDVVEQKSTRPYKQSQSVEIDQLIPKPNLRGELICQEPEFSVVNQESNEDLDFTELNSIDISESYDDSAFDLDQVTYVEEQPANTQLHELKTFQDTQYQSSSTSFKRKRNSFEETVHQNEQDLFGTTSPCFHGDSSCSSNNDQQIFCANPSLASLSDSTCFYNNQSPSISTPIKSIKRPHDDDLEVNSGKRVKLN